MSAEDDFNPYSHSKNSDVAEYVTGTRTPGPFAVLFVVIASIIAAGGAFFCTCLGLVAAEANGARNNFNPGGLIFGCGLFALLAYAFTAKAGLAIIGGMLSSTRSAPARSASWAVIFLSACVVAVVFFCCLQIFGIALAACAAITVGTVVIWKQPQMRRDPYEESVQDDDATGASTDNSSFYGESRHAE